MQQFKEECTYSVFVIIHPIHKATAKALLRPEHCIIEEPSPKSFKSIVAQFSAEE